MNIEKQIESLAKDLEELDTYENNDCDLCDKWRYEDKCDTKCFCKKTAIIFVDKGWCKVSDIVRDIISEIDNGLHDMAVKYYNAGHPEYFAVCEMVYHKLISPIKNKYESEDEKC